MGVLRLKPLPADWGKPFEKRWFQGKQDVLFHLCLGEFRICADGKAMFLNTAFYFKHSFTVNINVLFSTVLKEYHEVPKLTWSP